MITDFIVQAFVFLLWIPALILSGIGFVIPDYIYDGLSWGFQYFAYADGILPLFSRSDMSGPIGTYGIIDLLVLWFNVVFWLFSAKLIFKLIRRLVGVEIKT